MKEFFKKFITNGFNIALIVIQVVALICLGIMGYVHVFVYFFIMLEGSFFIVWGIKILIECKKSLIKTEQYTELPMTTEQINYYRKRDMVSYKNSKFMGIIMCIIGAILLFMIFSL